MAVPGKLAKNVKQPINISRLYLCHSFVTSRSYSFRQFRLLLFIGIAGKFAFSAFFLRYSLYPNIAIAS